MKINGVEGNVVFKKILHRKDKYILVLEEAFEDFNFRIDICLNIDETTNKHDKIFINNIELNGEYLPIPDTIDGISVNIEENNNNLEFECIIKYPKIFKIKEIKISEKIDKTKDYFESLIDVMPSSSDEEFLYIIKSIVSSGYCFDSNRLVVDSINYIDRISSILSKENYDLPGANYKKNNRVWQDVDLVQEFLNYIGIDLNVREMIENKTITVKKEDETSIDGICYYDEKEVKVEVKLTNTIKDPIVLMHELIHYSNIPSEGKRSVVSALLTEAMSYTYELIMLDYLIQKEEYKDEPNIYAYNYLYSMTMISKLLGPLIFTIKTGDNLTLDLIGDKMPEFRKTMIDIPKIHNSYSSMLYTLIGYGFALHNLYNYKKDKSYLERLKILNKSLNDITLEEALSVMGINNEYIMEDAFNISIPQGLEMFKEMGSKVRISIEGECNEQGRICKKN